MVISEVSFQICLQPSCRSFAEKVNRSTQTTKGIHHRHRDYYHKPAILSLSRITAENRFPPWIKHLIRTFIHLLLPTKFVFHWKHMETFESASQMRTYYILVIRRIIHSIVAGMLRESLYQYLPFFQVLDRVSVVVRDLYLEFKPDANRYNRVLSPLLSSIVSSSSIFETMKWQVKRVPLNSSWVTLSWDFLRYLHRYAEFSQGVEILWSILVDVKYRKAQYLDWLENSLQQGTIPETFSIFLFPYVSRPREGRQ